MNNAGVDLGLHLGHVGLDSELVHLELDFLGLLNSALVLGLVGLDLRFDLGLV